MAEIENLLKRAQMLEEEKDYAEALKVYTRILEEEPDNEVAFVRARAIKNNTLTIVRETIPQLAILSAHYRIYLDGVLVDGSNFACNTSPATFTVPVMLGKHRISVNQVAYTGNIASEEEVGNYTFEMQQKEQTIYLRYTKTKFLHYSELAYEEGTQSGGCYVATAVYGSYDCPQVWTLRRYRDYTLSETWYGRAFIRVYYTVSPIIVKRFGNTDWFKNFWKSKLDHMVSRLQSKGLESTPYDDKIW